MPNELTGDFDVVAEFALPAVNRLLAAMHRIDRFPHSMSLRVSDDPGPRGKGDRFAVVAAVDMFGDPPADHTKIGYPVPWPGVLPGTVPGASPLDSAVNVDVVSANIAPLVPSRLKGRAQLQLAPPTLQLAPGNNVTVRLPLRARYFPDPQTPPLAEFVHGELRLTAAVSQVASQTGSVVDIDIKANSLQIAFTPTWSSHPLTAEDVAGVEQLIRNALKTSFMPSSIALPPSVASMQFKAVSGGPGAVGVLLKTTAGAANPGSVTNVFLGAADQFAFAAGIDFIRAQFQPTLDAILSAPLTPVPIDAYVATATYTVTLGSASVDLQGGKIVLTINGHAHTPASWLPDFNFRVRQPFTLSPSGATAELVVGDIAIDITTGGVKGWLVSMFTDRFRSRIIPQRDLALERAGVRETVRRTLNADENFGGVLRSLLRRTGRRSILLGPGYALAYTSVEIRPSGIVLHGSLAVGGWPPPHVEFEQVPPSTTPGPHGTMPQGPDYSALKAWIPGGTIAEYEWKTLGQTQPGHTEHHTFVLIHPDPHLTDIVPCSTPVHGYLPLCLTVRGTRLSASGTVAEENVAATVCGFSDFPIVSGVALASNGSLPMIALARPDARGMVEITGHAAPRRGEAGAARPNLLVHFSGDRVGERAGLLVQALREAGRDNAVTALLVVVPAGQLASTPYTEGVTYAEDHGGAWDSVFGVKGARRPLTLIVQPDGKVAWRHEGELDAGALAAALRKTLGAGGPVKRGMLRSALRIGQLSPNFVFEYAPGRLLTLDKLQGQPVTLVFYRNASMPSIEAVRELTNGDAAHTARAPRAPATVVLAINDGDAVDAAKRSAGQQGLSATVVTDPQRAISRAYGVNVWPTIVALDASGVVRAIQYGRS